VVVGFPRVVVGISGFQPDEIPTSKIAISWLRSFGSRTRVIQVLRSLLLATVRPLNFAGVVRCATMGRGSHSQAWQTERYFGR